MSGLSSVQPRACGEWWRSCAPAGGAAGSAPRVRGMELRLIYHDQHSRFSPARAGNGARAVRGAWAEPVQPRACGEWKACPSAVSPKTGSAPRVRGMADMSMSFDTIPRFSPARAGNGCPSTLQGRCRPVQPRACGEWRANSRFMAWIAGSAPRVRGMESRQTPALLLIRFSPARAGNGFTTVPWAITAPVQPRACGEWGPSVSRLAKQGGSAPRVRGMAWSRWR